MTGAGSWIGHVSSARNRTPRGVLALADLLIDDPDTPPVLADLARMARESRIGDRPRARTSDPATSQAAAAEIRTRVRRPGSAVHRILSAYAAHRNALLDFVDETLTGGLTSLEVEESFGVREAHKRSSDLLRDGLLEVVRAHEDGTPCNAAATCPQYDTDDLVRDGGRVLRITVAGLNELARLEAASRTA